MSYAKPEMLECLRNHVLTEVDYGRHVRTFKIHDGKSFNHANLIIFTPMGTVITGDTIL